MWMGKSRDRLWSELGGSSWDAIVIGGGIIGASILRELARVGYRAALVEGRDFAWGASSRSTKAVHGGLRYLAQGKLKVTRDSVHARQRLLREASGLVQHLPSLGILYRGERPGRWLYGAVLGVYQLLAGQWTQRWVPAGAIQSALPYINPEGLIGGYHYAEGETDDTRLVLRVLHEASRYGGLVLNYVMAKSLLFESGQVVGVRVADRVDNRETDLRATAVINATGAWVDELRSQFHAPPRMRPLRGSHLVFPATRFPLDRALTFHHPVDQRPLIALPWEGATMLGTTDLDHDSPLDEEPAITPDEVAYLMAAVEALVPSLGLTLDDVIATFSGLRPMVNSEEDDPNKMSREHVVWQENGLLSVAGGKLTTFPLIAFDAVRALQERLPRLAAADAAQPAFEPAPSEPALHAANPETRQRLLARFGTDAAAVLNAAQPGELESIPGTRTRWVELRWAARQEAVAHLDDLLLRRVRLGLLVSQGGADLLPRIRAICQPELGWDDACWEAEEQAYRALWQRRYSVPAPREDPRLAWEEVDEPDQSVVGRRS